MIFQFIKLEWKQFTRSANFGKSLGIKIVMGLIALYFIVMFLFLGIGLYPALKKLFPEQDPFLIVNKAIFFWVLMDLLIRFFFQKLPVLSVKPLLTVPIAKKNIVHYVLGKSLLSFFNFLPLFALVPFSVVLIAKDYDTSVVLSWLVALILISLISNFVNFIIESFSAETELSYLPIIAISSGLYGLNHFGFIDISGALSNAILTIANTPIYLLVLVAILMVCYWVNYKILKQKLFLDHALKTKIKEVNSSNLGWTKNFGDIAPFMQLDLRLIWRNKRPKSSVFILVIGLLYGLFFYPNPQFQDSPMIYGFVGIFVTGIFLINVILAPKLQ